MLHPRKEERQRDREREGGGGRVLCAIGMMGDCQIRSSAGLDRSGRSRTVESDFASAHREKWWRFFVFPTPPSTTPQRLSGLFPKKGWTGLKRRPWIGGHCRLARKKKKKRDEKKKERKNRKKKKNPRHARAERGKAYCGGMQAGYECSAQIENGSLEALSKEKC